MQCRYREIATRGQGEAVSLGYTEFAPRSMLAAHNVSSIFATQRILHVWIACTTGNDFHIVFSAP